MIKMFTFIPIIILSSSSWSPPPNPYDNENVQRVIPLSVYRKGSREGDDKKSLSNTTSKLLSHNPHQTHQSRLRFFMFRDKRARNRGREGDSQRERERDPAREPEREPERARESLRDVFNHVLHCVDQKDKNTAR